MRELSLFVDESGGEGLDSSYYILTIVLHEQSRQLASIVAPYEQALVDKGLPDIPFHASPLMNGHDDYARLSVQQRASLLSSFMLLFHHLPIMYKTFFYGKRQYKDLSSLRNSMRRDLVNFFFDHLEYFQQFDRIKVYYDGGQGVVTSAIHGAIDYALARDAVEYRSISPLDYRLAQAADYACSVELVALKFSSNEETATDRRFFGSWGSFRRNVLKTVRKKRFAER